MHFFVFKSRCNDVMAEHVARALVVALFIAILYTSSVLILSWLFFTLYLMFKRRYKWKNPLIDSIAYSLVATFGLYALIIWVLNAANDVYVLLFHSDLPFLVAMLELWTGLTTYLMLAIFLVVFDFIYARRDKSKKVHQILDRSLRSLLVL